MRIALSIFCLFWTSLSAVDFSEASKSVNAELKSVNETLNAQRKTLFTEREKLARTESELQDQVAKKDLEGKKLQGEIEQLRAELAELSENLKEGARTFDKIEAKGMTLRRELEALSPTVYVDYIKPFIKKQDEALTTGDFETYLGLYCSFVENLVSRGSSLNRDKTRAVSSNGQVEEMRLLSLGFAVFYLIDDKVAGIAQLTDGYPLINPIKGLTPASLDGVELVLPVDFTNGKALHVQTEGFSVIKHLQAGGVIIYPLLFLGLLCLVTGLIKTTQLYLTKSRYQKEVEELISLIRENRQEAAHDYVNKLSEPLRAVLKEGLENHTQDRESLEELLSETILAELPKLDRFLTILSVTAGAAPLLGLLGTVMGIISTFEMISVYGSGEANRLAGGISEALITTEVGLFVAIPALIWHALLSRRLRKIVGNLELAMLSFINALTLRKIV